MTTAELASFLSIVPVREIPRTPPLNKFGGEFENGWEYFFDDLNNFLQQAVTGVKADDNIAVCRVGSVVTVTGEITAGNSVNIGISPFKGFTIDGITVDNNGNITSDTTRTFSISFIAR